MPKTREYTADNMKMIFNSGNKTYDNFIVSLGHYGGQIGGGVNAHPIRPYHLTTNVLGERVRPGHLQSRDLKQFPNLGPNRVAKVMQHTNDEIAVLYEFYHYRGHHRVGHGYLLMRNGTVLERFDIIPFRKTSAIVLDEAVKYLSDDYDEDGNLIV